MLQLEAKGGQLKQAHTKAIDKMSGNMEAARTQLKEKEAENAKLERKRREVEETVAMRLSIKATRGSGGGKAAEAADKGKERMKVCVCGRVCCVRALVCVLGCVDGFSVCVCVGVV